MGYEMCDPGLHAAPKATIKGCAALFYSRNAPAAHIHYPNHTAERTVAHLRVDVESP